MFSEMIRSLDRSQQQNNNAITELNSVAEQAAITGG